MKQMVLAVGVGIAVLMVVVSLALQPIPARAQESKPLMRALVVTAAANPRQIPKAHYGIYALSEYAYTPGGKVTITKKNDLIVEADMSFFQGSVRVSHNLPTGEYEFHLVPDNSRTIIKRFTVDNTTNAPLLLTFNPEYIDDPTERKKTELVRIGPSLAELEARIQALAKQNSDLASQVAELKKKVG
jgi:hypothetical protein